jgi:microcystin-dependent protein
MSIPSGIIISYASNLQAPQGGYLLCNGTAYSTATYPDLFAVIGYTYGNLNGNFRVPNLINSRPLMTNSDGSSIGETGGNNNITLNANNLATHNHGITNCRLNNHNHPRVNLGTMSVDWATSGNAALGGGNGDSTTPTGGGIPGQTAASVINISGNTGSTPGLPFSILNPFISMFYYIKI